MVDALARLETGGEPATHPRGNGLSATERADEGGEVSAGAARQATPVGVYA